MCILRKSIVSSLASNALQMFVLLAEDLYSILHQHRSRSCHPAGCAVHSVELIVTVNDIRLTADSCIHTMGCDCISGSSIDCT